MDKDTQRLCCVEVPWQPAADSHGTRFINEIVLAEESDEDGREASSAISGCIARP